MSTVQANSSQQPQIGLLENQSVALINQLNVLLADEHVLYVKLRNYHWNVVGPTFRSLHELYEEQYTQLATTIDELAERIRALGGHALGTMSEFVDHARLNEVPAEWPDAETMTRNLLDDHEQLVRQLRDDIETAAEKFQAEGVADLLTGMLQMHMQMAWMLRSTLG